MLNTARLAERWREAGGDPVRMAAALGEELAEEDNRIVTKSDLLATEAKLQTAMAELEARLYWRLLVGAGVMLAAIGLMIRYLTPVA